MTDYEKLKVAILRSEPANTKNPQTSALFVLYCIVDGLCSKAADFEHLFGTHVPYQHHLSRLVVEGFLVADQGCYFATRLGLIALTGYFPKEKKA